MKKKYIIGLLLILTFLSYAENKDIMLPRIKNEIGVDLIKTIETRAASRSFTTKEVSLEIISLLLWAGTGEIAKGNKTVNGYDTVSSASSVKRYSIPFGWEKQYIKTFIFFKSGIYEYIPGSHSMKIITDKNLIDKIGLATSNPQGAIIIVADYSKMPGGKKNEMTTNAALFTAGSVAQNITLAASATSMKTLIQIGMNTKEITKTLKLTKTMEPVGLISFGY